MCIMGLIDGRLIEVKTMEEPLLGRPKWPRPLNRGFNSRFYSTIISGFCFVAAWYGGRLMEVQLYVLFACLIPVCILLYNTLFSHRTTDQL